MIALSLNGANLYGYVKCNYGAGKDLNSAATDFVKTQLFKGAVDMMTKQTAQPTAARPTQIVWTRWLAGQIGGDSIPKLWTSMYAL